MAKNSFILYYNYMEQLEDLTDEQVGKLLRALFKYEINDTLPEFTDKELKIAFKFIKVHLDNDREKYKDTCIKRKQNIEKRWNTKNTNVNNCIQNIQEYTNDTDNDNVNDNDSDTDIYKKESIKEKGDGEINSPTPLKEKKSKQTEYMKLVQASGLSTKVQEQVIEWLEYKKWKYTEVGLKSLLTTVAKNVDSYGESAVCAVIVESMGNMWQGICWDKLSRKETMREEKEEAEYTVDGDYYIFPNGQRVHKGTYEGWKALSKGN